MSLSGKNMNLSWKKHQKLLLAASLLLYCMTIVLLMVFWKDIPDRVPNQVHVLGKTLSETSQKSFTLIPMLLIEGMINLTLSLVSAFPEAWNCKTDGLSKEKALQSYHLTRTFLISCQFWCSGLFSGLVLDQAFDFKIPSIFWLVTFGVSLFVIILYYCIKSFYLKRGSNE